MAKDFIVAIELGSSKITGLAGKKNLDGSITVLAVAQENATACIRRGVIYNIDKTMTALVNIRKRLESQLQTHITQAYVGVGGQSIIGKKNVIIKEWGEETVVTQEMVNELNDTNRNMSYPDKEILDAIPHEYKVDNTYQSDPVGIPCTRLEGIFLNILWRKTFFKNLNRCFKEAGIHIAEMYLAPLTLAECVLAEADRRAGCVLVDLGADTTTVAVYYKNLLRHLAVLPMGGANITRDLTSLQIEEDDAERMKIKYGSAYTENADIDPELTYPLGNDRRVESRKFIDIVEARVEEIVENVWFQVPAEYVDKLLSGIILTGGGANMKDIDKVFISHTHIDKIRFAKTILATVDGTQPEVKAQDGRLTTALSLLARGDMSCAGEPLAGGLFGGGTNNAENGARHTSGDTPGTGVVMSQEERERLEEERRRKEKEEERQRLEEERRRKEEERRIKQENSPWNKIKKAVERFIKGAIEDE